MTKQKEIKQLSVTDMSELLWCVHRGDQTIIDDATYTKKEINGVVMLSNLRICPIMKDTIVCSSWLYCSLEDQQLHLANVLDGEDISIGSSLKDSISAYNKMMEEMSTEHRSIIYVEEF